MLKWATCCGLFCPEGSQGAGNKLAERVLLRLQHKLQGLEDGVTLSVAGQVNHLIQTARDPHNLSRLFHGWQPYIWFVSRRLLQPTPVLDESKLSAEDALFRFFYVSVDCNGWPVPVSVCGVLCWDMKIGHNPIVLVLIAIDDMTLSSIGCSLLWKELWHMLKFPLWFMCQNTKPKFERVGGNFSRLSECILCLYCLMMKSQ